MSLDKAIEHGKEKRKPYRGSAKHSAGCRQGGSCDWCRGNRTIKNRRAVPADVTEQEHNGALATVEVTPDPCSACGGKTVWDDTVEIEGGNMARCQRCGHLTPYWTGDSDENL